MVSFLCGRERRAGTRVGCTPRASQRCSSSEHFLVFFSSFKLIYFGSVSVQRGMLLGKHNNPARASGSPAVPPLSGLCVCVCVVFWGGSSCCRTPPPGQPSLYKPASAPGTGKLFAPRVGVPHHPPQEWGFGAGGGSPGPGAGGEGDKQARGLIAVIITIIMAFIWLPNESDHRQREKLSIAQALMNFFANCNQARPSQLAD